LVSDISSIMTEEKINITGLSTKKNDIDTYELIFNAETTGIPQLSRLMGRIEAIQGIISVERIVN